MDTFIQLLSSVKVCWNKNVGDTKKGGDKGLATSPGWGPPGKREYTQSIIYAARSTHPTRHTHLKWEAEKWSVAARRRVEKLQGLKQRLTTGSSTYVARCEAVFGSAPWKAEWWFESAGFRPRVHVRCEQRVKVFPQETARSQALSLCRLACLFELT